MISFFTGCRFSRVILFPIAAPVFALQHAFDGGGEHLQIAIGLLRLNGGFKLRRARDDFP